MSDYLDGLKKLRDTPNTGRDDKLIDLLIAKEEANWDVQNSGPIVTMSPVTVTYNPHPDTPQAKPDRAGADIGKVENGTYGKPDRAMEIAVSRFRTRELAELCAAAIRQREQEMLAEEMGWVDAYNLERSKVTR